MEWIFENKEWLFSGLGITVLVFLKSIFTNKGVNLATNPTTNANTSNITINVDKKENNIEQNDEKKNESTTDEEQEQSIKYKSIDVAQKRIKILFIDDQKFKVVDILKKSGWQNTKIVKDINSLDSADVQDTDIFFVDIQGVGKKLGFQDEGLGLADALKIKYPNKKIVIYSAENSGDRFHKALKNADDSLSKNADPYEFQQIIENFFVK
jgi:hypothetical protein